MIPTSVPMKRVPKICATTPVVSGTVASQSSPIRQANTITLTVEIGSMMNTAMMTARTP